MKKPVTLRLLLISSLICFFCLFSTNLYSQTSTGEIKGTVKTSDNNPASDVTITIKEIGKTTVSDEKGNFSFKKIKGGTYTLAITFVGKQSQTKSVVVEAGKVVLEDFILQETIGQLAEVVITNKKSLNEKAAVIGKIAIAPLDLPQSVMVISKDVLEQQQSLHLSDVLKNTNGVYQMGATGGTQEEIAGRGYAFSSSNTFKNGMRFNNGIMPEISSLEKVEVLKGSSAILFGNVAAGGILNLVTKKPKFENGGEVSMRFGSYRFYKPSVDVYGAVNNSEKAAYRINASYENAGSFRNHVSSERIYVNPSFLYRITPKTDILVEGDYLKDNRTPDYGIGAIKYSLINVPRSQFLGTSWASYQASQKTITTTVSHQLTSNWQIKGTGSYQNYRKKEYGSARPASLSIGDDGTWSRSLQRLENDEKYYLGQLDLTGNFSTGSIKHTLLVGTDADRYETKTPAFTIITNPSNPNSNVYDVINVFNPQNSTQRTDIPAYRTSTSTNNPSSRFGAYIQDLVSINPKIKVLAGIRYSYMNTKSKTATFNYADKVSLNPTSTTYSNSTKSYNDAFSPRIGVVYQPLKTMSVFASYANSFTINTGTDIYSQPLSPSLIDQYEIGVKNELFKGLISANITLYRIVNSNLAQTALLDKDGNVNNNNTIKELSGETTSKGLEIDIASGSISGFSFIAGYSYNDMRYTGVNGNKVNGNIKGDRLRYNPAHIANASIYYTLSNTRFKGLNFGLTAFYVGNMVAGRNPTNSPTNTNKIMPLPDFTTFDFSAGYTYKKLSLRAKASNLFNKLGYYAHDDNSINPIPPRQFATTLAYKF